MEEELDADKKSCPHCGNPIPEDAILCLFCGEGVPVQSGLMGSLKHGLWGWMGVVIACLVLVSFLMAYVF